MNCGRVSAGVRPSALRRRLTADCSILLCWNRSTDAEDDRPLRHPRSRPAVPPVAADLHVRPRAAAADGASSSSSSPRACRGRRSAASSCLLSPQALGLTIPMALLVGLLIGLGRLSTDRESVALLACGVSPYRLLRPVLVLAVVATAATLYVMIEALPDANQKYREILFDIAQQEGRKRRQAARVLPGVPELGAVSAERGGAGRSRAGATSWSPTPASRRRSKLYMAARGRIVLDPAKRTVELVLTDGTKYATAGPGRVEHRRGFSSSSSSASIRTRSFRRWISRAA